jgi:hypothetical protein
MMWPVAIGAALLLTMVCVSAYGAVTLPGRARIPIHFGFQSNRYASKPLGLTLYPAAGALVFLVEVAVVYDLAGRHRVGGSGAAITVLLVMLPLLVVQAVAIVVARRQSGPDRGPGEPGPSRGHG